MKGRTLETQRMAIGGMTKSSRNEPMTEEEMKEEEEKRKRSSGILGAASKSLVGMRKGGRCK